MSANSSNTNRGKGADPRSRFVDVIMRVLRVVLPIGVSIWLMAWLLHKVNVQQVMSILDKDVNFWLILLLMIFTVIPYIIRGVRWGIQLRAAGVPRMTVTAESVSIFGAYALNLLVPYLGEAWRCVFIARRENVKLATVVGTDFGDRISDAVVVISLLGLSIVLAGDTIAKFLTKYPLGRFIDSMLDRWELYAGVFGALAVFFLCTYMFRDLKFFSGVIMSLKRIWNGFAVLFHMKGIGAYCWLTLGIWVFYFLKMYVCFFAFSFTREMALQPGMAMGLLPGLIVFVFGSLSIAVPSNGGLGPWNIAVMYALMLYGISEEDAASFTIVAWCFETVAIIICGVFSAWYVMTHSPKQDVDNRNQGAVPESDTTPCK